jgi:hypothetical protein
MEVERERRGMSGERARPVRWVSRSAGPLDGDPMDMAGLIALRRISVLCACVSVLNKKI